MLRIRMKSSISPLLSLLLFSSSFLSGCGLSTSTVATAGLTGAAVGAGTGALIGAAISNGDIAASALLGTAVGIPAGIAVAILYDQYFSEKSVREEKLAVIEANQRELFSRQREIDAMREQIRAEGPTGNPTSMVPVYEYSGETFGNPYR